MMGGIIVGTLLTLLFVPALYCLVFGVKPEAECHATGLITDRSSADIGVRRCAPA